MLNKKSVHFIIYPFLILLILLTLLPIFTVFVNSSRDNLDIIRTFSFIPSHYFLQNYQSLIELHNIWVALQNSFFIAFFTVVLSLYFSSMVAFGFHTYQFIGKKLFFSIVLATIFIPAQISAIGYYHLASFTGLIDNLWAVILPSLGNGLAIFLIYQYMAVGLQIEHVEAARMEGASEPYIFHRIALPLSSSILAITATLIFISSWNSFFYPLILLHSSKNITVPLMIAEIRSNPFSISMGTTSVLIIISILPIILLYSLLHKKILLGPSLVSLT